jgi:hypothetical protein
MVHDEYLVDEREPEFEDPADEEEEDEEDDEDGADTGSEEEGVVEVE